MNRDEITKLKRQIQANIASLKREQNRNKSDVGKHIERMIMRLEKIKGGLK